MIRFFLAKGDRGGSATITEGLEHVTSSTAGAYRNALHENLLRGL